MIDLSEEPMEENISITKTYLERCAKVNCLLEFELGLTGGEEDGVDNTDVDNASLYSQPEGVSGFVACLSPAPPPPDILFLAPPPHPRHFQGLPDHDGRVADVHHRRRLWQRPRRVQGPLAQPYIPPPPTPHSEQSLFCA